MLHNEYLNFVKSAVLFKALLEELKSVSVQMNRFKLLLIMGFVGGGTKMSRIYLKITRKCESGK